MHHARLAPGRQREAAVLEHLQHRRVVRQDLRDQLMNAGADSVLSENPDAFTAFTRAQRVKWGEVVKAAGVKIE